MSPSSTILQRSFARLTPSRNDRGLDCRQDRKLRSRRQRDDHEVDRGQRWRCPPKQLPQASFDAVADDRAPDFATDGHPEARAADEGAPSHDRKRRRPNSDSFSLNPLKFPALEEPGRPIEPAVTPDNRADRRAGAGAPTGASSRSSRRGGDRGGRIDLAADLPFFGCGFGRGSLLPPRTTSAGIGHDYFL